MQAAKQSGFASQSMKSKRAILASLLAMAVAFPASAATVALWLLDEPEGLYPSSILNDATGNGLFLAMGRGARIVEGRFGRALEIAEPAPLNISASTMNPQFGLFPTPDSPAGKVTPLHWKNANFAALLTRGERRMRSPGFANATDTKLNLGAFDWTVEFWFRPGAGSNAEGVVFELGEGPRGANHRVTRLSLRADGASFLLENEPASVRLVIPSKLTAGRWQHLAFVYDTAEQQLRHYADGVPQPLPAKAALKSLTHGEEAYFSVGRDGSWQRPLPGCIDELRFSDEQIYQAAFQPPASFSVTYGKGLGTTTLKQGPPLLFGSNAAPSQVVELGSRKHLFIDGALIAETQGITFTPNPPRKAEQVLDHVRGHLSIVQDENDLLRLYYRETNDVLAVMTSQDGIHWAKPDLGRECNGMRNIVVPYPVGLGNVLIDPNAPPERRWAYVSGIRKQAIFVFTSSDGWSFQPHEVAALPFSSGSQSVLYYDDQRQLYIGHHRSDYGMTPGGRTRRRFVISETRELLGPWPWERITPQRTLEVARKEPIQNRKLDPWFLDNGPLCPPGLGIELPTVLAADDSLDPVGTDIYTSKAVKYAWAPDTYLAFPAVYFHYEGDGPRERQVLGGESNGRGSGVTEVQLTVSRDGLSWQRYPRPAYVPIGGDGRNTVHMHFLTHGLVRRGNELWQYVGGHDGNGIGYHSAYGQKGPWPLIRLVQRLDGFVAAEAAYTGGSLRTRPLRFAGNRLRLNIDTSAVGYAQVGFLDEAGRPIPGFSVDECTYINGDFLNSPVEWTKKGGDVSALEGRAVQMVFRMRGAKLYAMQFVRE